MAEHLTFEDFLIEQDADAALKKKADKEFLPMQNGDVTNTFSNIAKIKDWVGFEPKTNVDEGLKKFIDWYNYYYG